MQKKILVVGSLAYDNLMQFEGLFKDVMVGGNFNIALTASNRKVGFGGCAGNIAFNLRLFGAEPLILTTVGSDFKGYEKWLKDLKVDIDGIHKAEDLLTAAAFIVTDKSQNQVIIFEPGAMNLHLPSQTVKSLKNYAEIAWAIIAPDSTARMVKIAAECKELGIPYLFDPAQQIQNFLNEDLIKLISDAQILILNEYESGLLQNKLGMSGEQISALGSGNAGTGEVAGVVAGAGASGRIYIETHGAKGCRIKTPEGDFFVKAVKASVEKDPTGCGDAFRAGLIYGLMQGFNIQKSCRIAALTATYNLENPGTQEHKFTLAEFGKRFEDSFGEAV